MDTQYNMNFMQYEIIRSRQNFRYLTQLNDIEQLNVQKSQEVLVQMPLNDIEAMEAMHFDIHQHFTTFKHTKLLSNGTNTHEKENVCPFYLTAHNIWNGDTIV